MNKKTIADLRTEKGLSQRELAKAVGLKPSTIAMYELGERTPSLSNATKIAQFFGVPVERIFFGNDARKMRANLPTAIPG